jgi:hypothetical protein
MPGPSPVFVAGTGRSGTSQLADVIGEHPLIHRIPMETHFIVDPGGLRDLADALTIRSDPIVGADALQRLGEMLRVRMVERRDRDRGHSLPEVIGERHYWAAVDRLWSDLVAATYDEPAPSSRPRVLPKYFGDRRELAAVLRRAVETMFAGAATDAGKPTWCEKTPFNLLSMDFLWELFPEATIVHVKRHPVAVVSSHLDQPWAPSTIDGVLAWLAPVYGRWLSWKASADLTGRRYVEVRAEDLAADWPAQREALFGQLGVEDAATRSRFEARSLSARDGQLDPAARKYVEGELGDVITAMGYA